MIYANLSLASIILYILGHRSNLTVHSVPVPISDANFEAVLLESAQFTSRILSNVLEECMNKVVGAEFKSVWA